MQITLGSLVVMSVSGMKTGVLKEVVIWGAGWINVQQRSDLSTIFILQIM